MSGRAKRRHARQKLKEKYAKVREDAQLAGLIVTTPEGAVRDERVSTGAAQLPAVIREALANNWATPDVAKPAIVANLLEPFFTREVGPDGNPVPPDRKQLIELAKVLKLLDQTQHERDHPEEKSASGINITLQNTIQATAAMRQNLEGVDAATEAARVMKQTEKAFS